MIALLSLSASAAFAGTPNEDFLVDMAREEFKIAGKITDSDLAGRDYQCVQYAALNGVLPEYNKWTLKLEFKSMSTIWENAGNGGFIHFQKDEAGFHSTAKGVSYQIEGNESVFGRKIEDGRLVFEHSVAPSRYYRGYPSVSQPKQIAHNYWICFEVR